MSFDYYAYIKSEQWYNRTEEVRKRNGGVCECCNMRFGTSVHHRTYKNLGKEKPEELLHVCDMCHKLIHRKESACDNKYSIWANRYQVLKELQKEAEGNLNG